MNEMTNEIQTPIMENYSPAQPRYAGFWIRAVAFIIDNLIISIPVTLISIPLFFKAMMNTAPLLEQVSQQGQEIPPELLQGIMLIYGMAFLVNIIYFILFVLYFSCMESGKHQSTWGKRAMGLKVTNIYGERISFWRAVGRAVSKVLSYMTLYIGFMLAGWTAKKQALHDFIVDTVVVYKDR